MNAAKIAGDKTGSSTRRSALSGGAPRSIAASSSSAPTPKMRPRSTTTTYGIDHVTCPTIWPTRARVRERVQEHEREEEAGREHDLGGDERQEHQEVRAAEPRPRQRASPRARATPIGVAIAIVATARIKALADRRGQGRVVQQRQVGVADPPSEREPLPDAARPAGVEREPDRDHHGHDRPREVEPGVDGEEAVFAPRVREQVPRRRSCTGRLPRCSERSRRCSTASGARRTARAP